MIGSPARSPRTGKRPLDPLTWLIAIARAVNHERDPEPCGGDEIVPVAISYRGSSAVEQPVLDDLVRWWRRNCAAARGRSTTGRPSPEEPEISGDDHPGDLVARDRWRTPAVAGGVTRDAFLLDCRAPRATRSGARPRQRLAKADWKAGSGWGTAHRSRRVRPGRRSSRAPGSR
jgi:hypothetical protein